MELIQPYVNRYGEWLDFAANAGGTALDGRWPFSFINFADLSLQKIRPFGDC